MYGRFGLYGTDFEENGEGSKKTRAGGRGLNSKGDTTLREGVQAGRGKPHSEQDDKVHSELEGRSLKTMDFIFLLYIGKLPQRVGYIAQGHRVKPGPLHSSIIPMMSLMSMAVLKGH